MEAQNGKERGRITEMDEALGRGRSAEGGFYGCGASRVRDAIAGSGGRERKKKDGAKKLRDVVMVKTVIDDSASEKRRESRVERWKGRGGQWKV